MSKYTKRADGRYVTTITVNGKRKYLYANNSKELDKKVTNAKFLTYQGINIDDEKITLKQWAEKWYEVNISIKEYNTQRNIRSLLENHIYPTLGNIRLKDLKLFHVKQLQKDMLTKGLTSTCNRTITTIKRILNDAVENDIIQKNVAFNIKSVKYNKIEKKPLTIYQDKLLVKVAKTHKYGLFFLILRYFGIRTEEIIPLSVDDINFKKRKIIIHNAVYFKNGKPYIKETKNKKKRELPILNIVYASLKKHVEDCINNNQKLLFVKQGDGCMLTAPAVRWILESFLIAINKQFEKEQKALDSNFELTKKNKIHFTDHILRHSYCTMLYYAGVKIKKAQELMGHSSADMVYNIYTHLDEERENAEELINDYIEKSLSKSLSK